MSKKQALTCIIAVGIGVAIAGPGHAQNILPLFGSPDVAVAPQYPGTVPNNAKPETNIQAITGFDRTFGFGSSSTNTRRADGNINQSLTSGSPFTEVNSNGHAIYIELFSPAIGALNGRGSAFPPATNLADGGSTSTTALTGTPTGCTLNTASAGQTPNGTCTQQPQVVEFQKDLRHVPSRRHRRAVVGHQRHQRQRHQYPGDRELDRRHEHRQPDRDGAPEHRPRRPQLRLHRSRRPRHVRQFHHAQADERPLPW